MNAYEETVERVKRHLFRRADYRLTFETPHGRRVLKDMFKAAGMSEPATVLAEPIDPSLTHWRDGAQASCKRIVKILKIPEDKILDMMMEGE